MSDEIIGATELPLGKGKDRLRLWDANWARMGRDVERGKLSATAKYQPTRANQGGN